MSHTFSNFHSSVLPLQTLILTQCYSYKFLCLYTLVRCQLSIGTVIFAAFIVMDVCHLFETGILEGIIVIFNTAF